MELLGHVDQIYKRALYSMDEDAPCYIPPKMLEEALKENLQCSEFKDWSYSIRDFNGSSNIDHHGIDTS